MRLWPLSLAKTQLPPTLVPRSKHTAGSPTSISALRTARPDEPAPIIAVLIRVEVRRRGGGPADPRDRLLRSFSRPPDPATNAFRGEGGWYADPPCAGCCSSKIPPACVRSS